MILAAGLGQRMRPLTDHLPKPMLSAGGKPLLQHHLENLRAAGVSQVIINLAYLGDKIREFVGDGSRFGVSAVYSQEPEPLETGGAILRALPLLGSEPFLLINGDVWTEFPLQTLVDQPLADELDGHLLLVPNPDFHPQGDFALNAQGVLIDDHQLVRATYAGISLLRPQLIASYPERRTKFPLGEVLRHAIAARKLSGAIFRGGWSDVGTPQRLQLLDQNLLLTDKQ